MTTTFCRALPYASHCDCCERSVNTDWVEKRGRYECDACQRDIMMERLRQIEEMQLRLQGTIR